jgi:hypothetical protein
MQAHPGRRPQIRCRTFHPLPHTLDEKAEDLEAPPMLYAHMASHSPV